ncbi:NAD(P)-dependent oxidoreductase [Pleomorphovibrio marinus]|uniref:NAD(P)-dependent oxidoreductase n=1 Tax=Pleomorphovibrio marinus TaxID=2164132 RepID=UPI000E0BC626|nr:NAD(P)-dependent oxidoreductase [Pleomorphovibrio marinus]
MKIGIIKEGKIPVDHRVPFTPSQIHHLQDLYEGKISFKVAPSPIRCFPDDAYVKTGAEVTDEMSDCDILMGVKEVQAQELIPEKTYFFFSHTMKKQVYNRELLQEILKKKIRLIDYEALMDEGGQRVVAFGRWAGIVGAYNGLWTYGKKSGLFDLKRAYTCFDKHELFKEFPKIDLPPIKIVVTGQGKVASGVLETLEAVGIKQVGATDFLQKYFDQPVFTQLEMSAYNQRKSDGGFDLQEFYDHPELYEGTFMPYTEVSDLLIAAAYWDPGAPKLFERQDVQSEDFNISVIADITCDIEGSIPTTLRASEITDPVYDISRSNFQEVPAFGEQNSISVMAIDNLPCELPRDSSEDFGKQLSEKVIPELFLPGSKLIKNATIAENGHLTDKFSYLGDYVNQTQTEGL